MISDRLLSEVERQKKYLDRLPKDFQFPLFNAMQALESQRRNGYRNSAAAAREMVDNSIEAGAKKIHMVFETKKQGRQVVTAVAFIDDGSGMLPTMARFALSWGGGTHFDDPNFIGRFGFGLPNASINQTKRVEVYTRTAGTKNVWMAWLDATDLPEHGLQTIPEPQEAELPAFVKEYMKRSGFELDHGTVVVWVEPDRLTYKTPASLKEHFLDDFGTTYRYLLQNIELKVDGVQVDPVDPLFLDPKGRYYRPAEDRGAILVTERSFPVEFFRDGTTGATHLKKLGDTGELERIRKNGKSVGDVETLSVGVIHLKIARLPLGFAYGRKGEAEIEPIDDSSKQRFEIRQSRRGMSFVRAGREIETVDAFPRSAKDRSSGLGNWPLLESYAYHWGIEVKFDPELDDVFGITNDKQRVRPIEEFWKLLADQEIDALLQYENNWQAKKRHIAAQAKKQPQATPEPSPAEVSASIVDTVTGKPTPIPEHEKPKAQETFKKAATERSEVTGKTLEEAAKAIEAEANRRPFRIDYFEDPYGPFYKPDWDLGYQIVVWVNREHPFYETCYISSKSKLAKEALDLFLIALSKAELTAVNATTRQWYEYQRTRVWSEFLAISMKDLATRFETVEEEEEEQVVA